jgi:hypothetical protein
MALKSPEAAIRSALVADASVARLLGTRIYPVIAPASAAAPFATYRRSAVQRSQSLAGPTGVTTVLLALDLYAESYESVRELADVCRVALDGYGGVTPDSVLVNNVSLDNEADGFAQLAGGEAPPLYSVSQTYSILWQET